MSDDSKIVRISLEEIKRRNSIGHQGETDWDRLDSLTDEEIEAAVDSDPDAAPLVDASFWDDASHVSPDRMVKVEVDVLEWFKRQSSDYQSAINQALRSYIREH